MKNNILRLILFLLTTTVFSQSNNVSVVSNDKGMKLVVDGKDFIVNGMNWDYYPIGTNYAYSLWSQPEVIIKAALDSEMDLLKNMGVNTLRQYVGIPAKWITYIYENYGIYTMLNHTFGRYGLTLNRAWVANTEYSNASTRTLPLEESKAMVEKYKNTSGLLLFMLGNENNYGLFWDGAETENIPVEDRKSTMRAHSLYTLFNEAVVAMKKIDKTHPMAICNGDLLFLDLIKQECPDIDILGTNMYRGVSFGDAFKKVKEELNKQVLFTEFGADAFSAISNREDQKSQAYYMVGNWKEIYENAAGLGKSGNSLGGFTFQFSDGWWKYGQTKNLDIHDTNASWSNGGYALDLNGTENNMNEEWFGICAKGPTDSRGLYDLYPRASYYALKEVHYINPYAAGATLENIDNSFTSIQLMDAVLRARGDKASIKNGANEKIRLSNLQAEFTTNNIGWSLITTPKIADPENLVNPKKQGFDDMKVYFMGVEGNSVETIRGNINFNILGRIVENPIDEVFYESRGRSLKVNTDQGNPQPTDLNRVQECSASCVWNTKDFDFRGFHRTRHHQWGYEGDFFGLYPEANYGLNLDIYNRETLGFEVDGKGILYGFKAAFGLQLWWGADPALLLKYTIKVGEFDVTDIHHEDLADAAAELSSIAFPLPKTRRTPAYLKTKAGAVGIAMGGLWGGTPLNGREFQTTENNPADANSVPKYIIYTDKINLEDNWAVKAKLTYSSGVFNWYGQNSAMSL
jgi:hypothetical protein